MKHLAVVTGASRGIGRAMARRLAAEGIAVAAVSRTLRPGDGSLEGSLEETVQLIRAEGGVVEAFVADLGQPDLDRQQLVQEIEQRMGATVDILINNAAAARRDESWVGGGGGGGGVGGGVWGGGGGAGGRRGAGVKGGA